MTYSVNKLQNIVTTQYKPFTLSFFIDTEHEKFSTNTYFNIFDLYLWRKFTSISSYFIRLNAKGNGKIFVKGTDINNNTITLAIIDVIGSISTYTSLDESLIYVYLIYDNTVEIINSFYYTNEKIKLLPKVAIIATTYNREEDITRLIKSFLQFTNTYKNLFDVNLYIINNGNDFYLPNYNNITYIKTEYNCGGAGGFTEGVRETLQKLYTHIIFADDDADFIPETLFRSISLLSNLKVNCDNYIINSAMFDKAETSLCSCLYEGLDNRCLRQNYITSSIINSENLQNILTKTHQVINKIEAKDRMYSRPYAAWWYCIFPAKIFDKFGLPDEGYFFRGDDIEFSLRSTPLIFSINGICVAHPKFLGKDSNKLRIFFNTRNFIINNYKYFSNPYKNILKHISYKFYLSLHNSDLIEANIISQAVKESLNYNNKRINGQSINHKLNKVKIRKCKITLIVIFIFNLLSLFIRNKQIKNSLKQ